MAELATHPALKARPADLSWVLDRKKGELGASAADCYVEIVRRVDRGVLNFPYGNGKSTLYRDARHLLRWAMYIGLGVGRDKPAIQRAREAIAELRIRAIKELLPLPTLWLSELDLDFRVSDPGEVGKGIEELIPCVTGSSDPHGLVEVGG